MRFLASMLGMVAVFAMRSAIQEGFRNVLTAAANNKPAACLTMLGNTTRDEDRNTYIIGSIRNNCDHKIGHVTIAFKLDRRSGSKFDLPDALVLAYSNDVRPGETRSFKTAFSIGKNTTYRFDGITAF